MREIGEVGEIGEIGKMREIGEVGQRAIPKLLLFLPKLINAVWTIRKAYFYKLALHHLRQ